MSAELLDACSIIMVVILSFLFLKVRYHWTQILGILICLGGLGLLVASDAITYFPTPFPMETALLPLYIWIYADRG